MAFNSSDWLVSTWDAGQSNIMTWSQDNVRFNSDGSADFILSEAPSGSSRPYLGGEIQSDEVATTGTWSWTAKAPDMVDGAVFGLFLYREDHWNDPWLEYDFEFVGGDTTKVELNIHMEDANGNHISLEQGPTVVDLGFDASQREAHYEVTVTETSATFRVDGEIVGTFDASDMPGGVWYTNPMKSFVDLWAVAPAQEAWAGEWNYPGSPLVATVESYEIRPGEYTTSFDGTPATPPDDNEPEEELPAEELPDDNEPVDELPDDNEPGEELPGDDDTQPLPGSIVGTDGSDTLNGTSGADVIYGLGGNDTIDGKGRADEMHGGAGDDAYFVDNAGDQTIEEVGGGYDTTHARIDWTLAANVEALVLRTNATIDGTGNAGDNAITGNNAPNTLMGLAGADVLDGGGRNDILVGGTGDDLLVGGGGTDAFVFFQGDGNDRIVDFTPGRGEHLDIRDYTDYVDLREEGGGTRVVLSDSDSILLEGVAIGDLSASNFLFDGVAPPDMLDEGEPGGGGGRQSPPGRMDGADGGNPRNGTSKADVIHWSAFVDNAEEDTFVLTKGRDRVTSFRGREEEIDLMEIASIDDFDDVPAAVGHRSTGVPLPCEEGMAILDGIFGSNLDAGDFIL